MTKKKAKAAAQQQAAADPFLDGSRAAGSRVYRPTEVRFLPETINEAERTIDIVIATETPVRRRDYEGFFDEVLVCTPEAIRTARLDGGISVLNTHSSWSLSDVLGAVIRWWIENGELRGTLKFSRREDAVGYWQDVVDGVIRHNSVGYKIHAVEVEERDDNAVPVYRITDWEPLEVSFVPVPADPNSGVRSEDSPHTGNPERASTPDTPHKENTMEDETIVTPETESRSEAAAPVAVENIDIEAVRAAAEKAATERVTDILAAVRAAKLGNDVAETLIASGQSVDAARKEILNMLANAADETEIRSNITVSRDETQTRREAVQEYLLHRSEPGSYELTEKASDFRGLDLVGIAREMLVARGEKVRGLGNAEIAIRALATSDFPAILGATVNKSLRDGYTRAPQTFQPLARVVFAKDFKEMSRVQLGELGKLEEIAEGGEYTFAVAGEGKEIYKLKKFGKIFSITWETIVNDDLSAFTRVPAMFGRRAGDVEADLFWGVFTGNPDMADGKTLFHADHGNLGTAADVTVTSVSEAEQKLLEQTGLAGEYLSLRPEFLICAPDRKVKAQQVLGNVTATKSGDVNPHQNAYTLIVEPRLKAAPSPWFMAAGPDQIDTIEMAFLEGYRQPFIEQRQGFEVDGLQIKARHCVGVKAIDHRGFVKNAGV